jgi:hypothetical protein
MRLRAAILAIFLAAAIGLHAAPVPFVGCASNDQGGPHPAPTTPGTHKIDIPERDASQLAYYEGTESAGVLAPRGWHCFEISGSDGVWLAITTEAITADSFRKGFTGPVVLLSVALAGTSGRFEVADVAARVFPAYRDFVRARIEEDDFVPKTRFVFHTFPGDKMTYQSDHQVEFTTSSNTRGLGTYYWLKPSNLPIIGFASLVPNHTEPDLTLLAIRLPKEFAPLTAIIRETAEKK